MQGVVGVRVEQRMEESMNNTRHTSMNHRCFFVDCKTPATHSVRRLWQIPGKTPFGLLYCCDAHRPGSGPTYHEHDNTVAVRRQRLAGRSFYEVKPIA